MTQLHKGDALIVVDMQKDFLPGGALGVAEGDVIVPVVNAYVRDFQAQRLPIFFSRDWHPDNHCSFKAQGGPWPPHCIADTEGAALAPGLTIPHSASIVSKATRADRDAYSAFQDTELDAQLRTLGVQRVFVCGLATDYCVRATAEAALAAGFETFVLEDAVRAVNVRAGDGDAALQALRERGAKICEWRHINEAVMTTKANTGNADSALLTDLYQLTMLSAYYELDMERTAVFEYFVRRLPDARNFLVAAGLQQVLDYLERLHFTSDELQWLSECGRFKPAFIERLAKFRFTGEVYAMPEGTVFFGDEPVLRVIAPLPEAQLIESRIINLMNLQISIASKAARCRLAAGDKRLVDFGMRRAHGYEAALLSSRASCIGGFDATACVQASRQFDIPMSGTMAHSFIQAHDREVDAFANFASCHPDQLTLLIDTYDTAHAAHTVAALSKQLAAKNIRVGGVRIDSGDLGEEARRVRSILDAAGCSDIKIIASGSLDENVIATLIRTRAPIDSFGVGTKLSVSCDAPALDCAYKLHEYAGKPRHKRSASKATWPGRRQVHRTYDDHGYIAMDLVGCADEVCEGKALLQPAMRNGRRVCPDPSLEEIRTHCKTEIATLPIALRSLEHGPRSPVKISPRLRELAAEMDRSGH